MPHADLMDSASATAAAVAEALADQDLLAEGGDPGLGFLVTDNLERFHSVGTRFLGRTPEPVELVDLVAGVGPFTRVAG